MELKTQIFLSASALLVLVAIGVAFANFNTQGTFFNPDSATGECGYEVVKINGQTFDSFQAFKDKAEAEGVSDKGIDAFNEIYKHRINSEGNLELKNTQLICEDKAVANNE